MEAFNSKRRSQVLLVAYDEQSALVEEATIPYDEYYGGSPTLIDDDAYRARRKIRRLTGKIYNSAGKLQSEFENFYDKDGEYVRSRITNPDGSVTEE